MNIPDSLFFDARYADLEPDGAALLLELLRIQHATAQAPTVPFKVTHGKLKIKMSGFLYGRAIKPLLMLGFIHRCKHSKTEKPLKNWYRFGDELARMISKERHAEGVPLVQCYRDKATITAGIPAGVRFVEWRLEILPGPDAPAVELIEADAVDAEPEPGHAD